MKRFLALSLCLVTFLVTGCSLDPFRSDDSDSGSTPAPTASISGSVALNDIETGNLQAVRTAVASGSAQTFASFTAMLFNSTGQIATATVADREFSFTGINLASNLYIEVAHTDPLKRKFRLLYYIDALTGNLTVVVNEESTTIGLIIEAAKAAAEPYTLTVAQVSSSLQANITLVKNALIAALKAVIANGSTAEDNAGLIAQLATAVTEGIKLDTTKPVISAITASGITKTSATITWTTDENSTSLVEYGLTTAYGTSTVLNTTKVKAHSVTITGLTEGKTYHYRVKSKDLNNNEAVSADQTFTTSATLAPEINVKGNGNTILTGSTVTSTASDTQWAAAAVSTAAVEKTFTIYNDGNKALTITGISISGTSSSTFSIVTPTPTTVAAAGNATFKVKFTPNATAGIHTAVVQILSDDADEGTYTFKVQAALTGVGANSVTFSPAINAGAYDVATIYVVVSGLSDKTPYAAMATKIKDANGADVVFTRQAGINQDANFNNGMVLMVDIMNLEVAGTFSTLSFYNTGTNAAMTLPSGTTVTVYANNVSTSLGSKQIN